MNIDFKLLKKQKKVLNDLFHSNTNNKEANALLGIINMLDALEDEHLEPTPKKEYYFLLGEEISSLYFDSEFEEVIDMITKDRSCFDLAKYKEGENPEYLLGAAAGWMGYAEIHKKEYEQLLTIQEQEA